MAFCCARRACRFSRSVTSWCVMTQPPAGFGCTKAAMTRPSSSLWRTCGVPEKREERSEITRRAFRFGEVAKGFVDSV